MANSADPDQKLTDNWSGSTLFAKAGYIRAQQDRLIIYLFVYFSETDISHDIKPYFLEKEKTKKTTFSF